ncbi:MAG: hypothetical protein ACOYVD_01460 [Bacillota bacterium]
MRYSQFFIVLLALSWVFIPLSQVNRFLFLGVIAIYLAVHNLVGYWIACKGSFQLRKYEQIKKRMGEKWGPPAYLIIFVFLPLALGLYVTIIGLLMNIQY